MTALSGITATYDTVYDGVNNLKLDIFRPRVGTTFPGVVWFHGNGWRGGFKEDQRPQALYLANRGFAVFVPNYRLAPPGGSTYYAQQKNDYLNAMIFAKSHALTAGHKVGCGGGSAGAHIALWLGTNGVTGTSRPDAVVAWSGVWDMRFGNYETGQTVSTDIIDPTPVFDKEENYLNSTNHSDAVWADASPITHLDVNTPPTYWIFGTNEAIPTKNHYAALAGFQNLIDHQGYDHHKIQYDITPGNRHSQKNRDVVMEKTVLWMKLWVT